MIIGIDLDNTIINYDETFLKIAIKKKLILKSEIITKELLKKQIIKKSNIEKWKEIQGIAYGKNIFQSRIMNFFLDFLILCKLRNFKIFIISHKTKYGHYDNETLLREKAYKFLLSKKIINSNISPINKSHIFFCDTLEDKIVKIKQLKCDFFIDDLKKVLLHKSFPKFTKPIYLDRKSDNFNSKGSIIKFKSWSEIISHFFCDISKLELKEIIQIKNNVKINSFRKHHGRANSQIYKICTKEQINFSLKIYPKIINETFNRIDAEFSAYKFLYKNKFYKIPKPILKLDYANAALFGWIEGKNKVKKNQENINRIINFVTILKKISNKVNLSQFNFAKEAIYKKENLTNDIDYRYKRLLKLNPKNKIEYELNKFLKNKFIKIYKKLKFDLKKINRNFLKIKFENLILSPSDLGFNNIISNNNDLYFFDFEYFGFDDPVKLTSDFIWHPSNSMSKQLQENWIISMNSIFSGDKYFSKRLKAYHYLLGIKWILIILNIFDPIKKIKIINAKSMNENQYIAFQKKQLELAINYFNKINYQITKNIYEI